MIESHVVLEEKGGLWTSFLTLLVDSKEKGKGGGRETEKEASICRLTCWLICWLILAWALPGIKPATSAHQNHAPTS